MLAMSTAAAALPARSVLGGASPLPRPSARAGTVRRVRAAAAPRAAIADPPASVDAAEVPPTTGTGRKTVVVLGSGWGAISFVKSLEQTKAYDVILVSPRNYFLYTPLLPGAATGAVEERSIVEPIRRPIAEKGYKYYEASCIDVDPAGKKIVCRAQDPSFECADDADECPWHAFDVEYDYLVTAVGAVPNTFGVPGVEEHAMFFKEIAHASKFRREVNERFERATLPDVPEARLKELLSFVVIGAGPTGVELAAELYDMVYEDVAKMYPGRLLPHVKISIIDLQEKILSAYDRRIAEYATDFFQRANIECLLNKQVQEVKEDSVVMKDSITGAVEEIPAGLSVWCSGIKLNPLCEKIMDKLPAGSQENRRSLATDKNLRVKGSNGTIFAIGDCATMERPRSLSKALELFRTAAKCDEAGVCEVNLDKETVKAALAGGVEEFPHLEEVINNIDDKFAAHADAGERCTFEGFKAMLTEVDNGLRALPATAQVAKQEGEYLASFFNACDADAERLRSESEGKFDYVHKGSLAYIGKNAAVADIPGFAIIKGVAGGLIWKSFETISQVSVRNIFLVAADMIRTKLFGRDISRMQ
jgi:NADH:ubiquinone reductase (non-electrogenic)